MYLGGELYDIDAIESDSDNKYSSGSEDEEEFEKFLSNSKNSINKSIQGEIVKRRQQNKVKKKNTFEDEMEEEIDSIISSIQEKYLFTFPSSVFVGQNKIKIESSSVTSFDAALMESEEKKPSAIKSAKSPQKRKRVTFAKPTGDVAEKDTKPAAEKEETEMETEDYGTDYDENKNDTEVNDSLLYDPEMDNDDALWVENERRRGRNMPSKNGKLDKPPNSDAVLDCPSCLSTLCLDCQRHELYTNQYRAMFVMNCRPVLTEELHYQSKAKKRKGMKQETEKDETYHPVRCSECNTEVGVYDKEEIYHFFNVLASRA
ncbi:DgyrCDS10105 [Dimorphilus gyrociliatus]|uniref:DgyrCDS10105 n=1 Tax=Dimorphilus gyrociliatus TaxID=2664684 RepID=A0A7I8VZF4_9ANNE|nr:DgyrCDS10105 [Dimorphilus gyrociliatus]